MAPDRHLTLEHPSAHWVDLHHHLAFGCRPSDGNFDSCQQSANVPALNGSVQRHSRYESSMVVPTTAEEGTVLISRPGNSRLSSSPCRPWPCGDACGHRRRRRCPTARDPGLRRGRGPFWWLHPSVSFPCRFSLDFCGLTTTWTLYRAPPSAVCRPDDTTENTPVSWHYWAETTGTGRAAAPFQSPPVRSPAAPYASDLSRNCCR
jgi:hypothetical protein